MMSTSEVDRPIREVHCVVEGKKSERGEGRCGATCKCSAVCTRHTPAVSS